VLSKNAAATSTVQNSAQGSSWQLKFVGTSFFPPSADEVAKKARVFVPGLTFQLNLMFTLYWKGLLVTNTRAYLVKKFLSKLDRFWAK